MSRLVEPKTFLIGTTGVLEEGLIAYLRATDQLDFLRDIEQAQASGVTMPEILCSFYAKLCYMSLVPGKNENLTKIRPIAANIKATLESGHGSVFEHVNFNLVTHNCSRVLTHELVRHHAGTAYSQESGRYCRVTTLDFVMDPILESVRPEIETFLDQVQWKYDLLCAKLGLDTADELEDSECPKCGGTGTLLPIDSLDTTVVRCDCDNGIVRHPKMSFDKKKKLTSALRRILPEGRANDIGWSMNIRAARHIIMTRTSRGAEWEIRKVFAEVYEILKNRHPLLFCDAKERIIDGVVEVTGMVTQPYMESK